MPDLFFGRDFLSQEEGVLEVQRERLGTLSILAALDLHTGHVIAQVHKRHRSKEFIQLLKEIDEFYPATCQIRIILDNHSSHISKETMKFLEGKPNRFIFCVFLRFLIKPIS